MHEKLHEPIVSNTTAIVENCMATILFFVADTLLIYRCFVLWGNRKLAVALPLFLLVATTVCNIMGLYYMGSLLVLQSSSISPSLESQLALGNHSDLVANIGNWFSLATNIITTFLTVLRIWMMTREIQTALGPSAAVRYYSAIAMVIESGALSSTSLLMVSVVQSTPAIDLNVANTINQQLLAIAPTLIIVRVGLGKGFDNVQDSLHASHAANSHVPASGHLTARATGTISAIHFQSVREAESVISRVERSGEESQEVPSTIKNEKIARDGAGAMV